MVFRKQNLFLFYEKNAALCDIQLQLVNSYMNRFIIDEDAQFELIGIYVGSEWRNYSKKVDRFVGSIVLGVRLGHRQWSFKRLLNLRSDPTFIIQRIVGLICKIWNCYEKVLIEQKIIKMKLQIHISLLAIIGFLRIFHPKAKNCLSPWLINIHY